jgi:outer membrane lipoprotein LolB
MPSIFRTIFARLVAASALCLLAACRMLPTPDVVAVTRTEQPTFALESRIAVSDGEHAANAGLEWRHSRDGNQWTVLSPFGQIVARLNDSPTGAELQLADGKRWHAADAAELLPALLPELANAGLPHERLTHWVQAAPHADAEVRELDDLGRPALVIDRGWRIEYFAYMSDSPAALPQRLNISRGEFRLRLMIDAWQTPQMSQ